MGRSIISDILAFDYGSSSAEGFYSEDASSISIPSDAITEEQGSSVSSVDAEEDNDVELVYPTSSEHV